MPRKLALCSSTSPDRHLSYHSPYLVPQPYIIVACLGCGQKKTAAATLKATGGLSCVLSAGISVPEEEVAPLDARQQVLGATGWYDRSCIMAGHAPAARAGRHSSCPIQDQLSQAWKWHCFVHEASRMVLLSAGERKGRCTVPNTSSKSHHLTYVRKSQSSRLGVLLFFAARFRAFDAPPNAPGISQAPSTGI